MTHAVFLEEACRILQENGIHTAIDTCGAVPWSSIERVLPYADLFLYDIKKMDPVLHKAYTGIDNTQILNNLKRLTHADAKLIIRGLRAVTDFESEMQIAQTNHSIEPEIDTMFFTTSLEYAFLSSTIAKEVAFYGSDVSKLVPEVVQKAFREKYDQKLRKQ